MYGQAQQLINKISELGFEAYIVGGFARDAYMGNRSKDIDICTSAKYDDLKKHFKIKSSSFGSMKIRYKLHTFEVTTYRKDLGYIKSRYPKKVEYVKTLKEDLQRRDFTINTLCIDKEGNFIDLLNASEDIDNKIIKCVGNSDKKISEDILRSLRAIRFATVLDFELDDDLKKSIKKYAYLLDLLSDKRKKEEIDKIYKSPNRVKGVKYIFDLELYPYLKKFVK